MYKNSECATSSIVRLTQYKYNTIRNNYIGTKTIAHEGFNTVLTMKYTHLTFLWENQTHTRSARKQPYGFRN